MKINKEKESLVSQDLVKELLLYNPVTGKAVWNKRVSQSIKVGDIAGSIEPDGYLRINIKRKHYSLHRIIWLYMTGKFPTNYIDHINGIKSDNRWCNLREATASQNAHNSKLNRKTSTDIKGITRRKKKYSYVYFTAVVRYTVDNKKYNKNKSLVLLPTRTEEEILKTLSEWLMEERAQLHKEFTNHG